HEPVVSRSYAAGQKSRPSRDPPGRDGDLAGLKTRYTAHQPADRDAMDSRKMKIVSLNVGLPREVTWRGARTTTGIYKQPVGGRVALRKLNLDGDRQADLTVHGGEHK